MESLILNVEVPEHSGTFRKDELWQKHAYNLAIENISSLIRENRRIRENNDEANRKNLLRVHDAIFVSGGRGTGKTVFLSNLEFAWKNSKNRQGRAEFLDIIDPTILIDQDNFVHVVIAHINEFMQDKIKDKQKYHNLLGLLAESLGQTEYNLRDVGGLDRIIFYQSSMDLEYNFHKYLDYCCDSVDADVFILPIDDVDMALGKAHDVLETIRRLLSCPRLIPVVCGDRAVYIQILKDFFKMGGSACYKARKLFSDDEHFPEHLAKQYWRKVFPEQLNIAIEDIKYLLPKITISRSDQEGLLFNELMKKVHILTSPLVNGVENSHILTEPDTSRKLIQFVKSFLRYDNLNAEDKVEESFWDKFLQYSESYGIGRGYLVSDAEIRVNIEDDILTLKELPLFNVKLQNQIAEFNSAFKHKQYFGGLFKDVKPILNVDGVDVNNNDLSKLKSWQISQIDALRSQLDNISQSIIPMPPLEIYKYGYSISTNATQNLSQQKAIDEKVLLLISLYTHDDFYVSSPNKTKQIYFGKAFELFALSLIYDLSDSNKCIRVIEDVLYSKPLNSIHDIAPTKTFDLSDSDNKTEENEDNRETEDNKNNKSSKNTKFSSFVKDLNRWEMKHKKVLMEARCNGLCHLLSITFNKVFNQLNQMRINNTFGYNTNNPDNLFHIATRFNFVLLSSLGGFLKINNNVALMNTAITRNNEYLLTEDAKKSDTAYRVNVLDFINSKDEKNRELMTAIVEHPIIGLASSFSDIDNDVINAITLQRRLTPLEEVKQKVDLMLEIPSVYNKFTVSEIKKICGEDMSSYKTILSKLIDWGEVEDLSATQKNRLKTYKNAFERIEI